jgi:hypothetical protein
MRVVLEFAKKLGENDPLITRVPESNAHSCCSLAPYTFAYKPIGLEPSDSFPEGPTAYRPLLLARLVVPSRRRFLKSVVLADSGAGDCVFPQSFAAALGFGPQMAIMGVVGNTGNATYYDTVGIELPE